MQHDLLSGYSSADSNDGWKKRLRPIFNKPSNPPQPEKRLTDSHSARRLVNGRSLTTSAMGSHAQSSTLLRLQPQHPKPLRILDFDLENRPLSYLGNDFTTDEITAIACSWVGEDVVHCWLLGQVTLLEMVVGFLEFYNQADIVTGHFIRRHDLPHLNAACMELGLPVLQSKMTSDTKIDLVKRKGLSASQENLSHMFGLSHGKEHMSQIDWRMANRLTPEGLARTRERVVGDVQQHKELRVRMIQAGLLGPSKMWRSK